MDFLQIRDSLLNIRNLVLIQNYLVRSLYSDLPIFLIFQNNYFSTDTQPGVIHCNYSHDSSVPVFGIFWRTLATYFVESFSISLYLRDLWIGWPYNLLSELGHSWEWDSVLLITPRLQVKTQHCLRHCYYIYKFS